MSDLAAACVRTAVVMLIAFVVAFVIPLNPAFTPENTYMMGAFAGVVSNEAWHIAERLARR